jgi:hypothetical protein
MRFDSPAEYQWETSTGAISTTADIHLAADSAYGIILNGAYTSGAIRMGAGETIGFDDSNSITMSYNSSTQKMEFRSCGVLRASIDMTPGGSGADMN